MDDDVIRVRNADELMTALAPQIGRNIQAGCRDLNKSIVIYNRRYPYYTAALRISVVAFILMAVVVITLFWLMGRYGEGSPGALSYRPVIVAVVLAANLPASVAALCMIKRTSLPRPKRDR